MLGKLRRTQLLVPAVMAAVGLTMLVSLGTWQLKRKAWKDGLIAQLVERTRAAPVSLEEALRRWRERQDIEYLRVRVRGTFHHIAEIHMHALERGVSGWHVITPLTARDGIAVFVNRGFVAQTQKDRATRSGGLIEGEAEGYISKKPEAAQRTISRIIEFVHKQLG